MIINRGMTNYEVPPSTSLRKRRLWRNCRDFITDNNGTLPFVIPLDPSLPSLTGSMGLPPDRALMASEKPDRFDEIADKNWWYGERRKHERDLYERVQRLTRITWMHQQLVEFSHGRVVNFNKMTTAELTWFRKKTAKLHLSKFTKPQDFPIDSAVRVFGTPWHGKLGKVVKGPPHERLVPVFFEEWPNEPYWWFSPYNLNRVGT